MFHGRQTNCKTDRLHERALRIVCNGYVLLYFQDMLNKDNSISIYHQNIQFLAIKILEILNSLPGKTLKNSLREEQRVILSVQNKN